MSIKTNFRFILIYLLFLAVQNVIPKVVYAQDKCNVKFGRVSAKDFDISNLNVDTSDGAVIIADMGHTIFQGTREGRFQLQFEHKRRVMIMNKNGFDLATVEIPLYITSTKQESLYDVKAVTYNLIDGKVVATPMNSDAIFDDKKDRNYIFKKFTLPLVREGSIIEYTYTINSDFLFNLQHWTFQGKFPIAWSEYEADIPDFFDYIIHSQGYQSFYIDTEKQSIESYPIAIPPSDPLGHSQEINLTANVHYRRWVMKDVPAIKEEPYTASFKNIITKIEFQLKGIQYPDEPYQDVLDSWEKTGDDLLKADDFGADLDRDNEWLDNVIKKITAGAVDDLDKAKRIYYYVKNNIKSTGGDEIWLDKKIKDVFKDKSGPDAAVNMLLIAMLRFANLYATPVILSTREHGYAQALYPLIRQYNYVIGKLRIDSTDYFLDATQSYLGFGYLPAYCYNGDAREITEATSPLVFSADTLHQTCNTVVNLFSDTATAGSWVGSYISNMNYIQSCDVRKNILSNGQDEYEKDLRTSFPEEISITNIKIANLDSCEQAVQLNLGLSIEGNSSDSLIYFNPMINNEYAKNPFKSAIRKYPVEIPYLIDDNYTLNIEIPKGYELSEKPKSAKVTFNETQGLFKYHVSIDEGMLTIATSIKFNQANFSSDDYQNLRDFFDYIVKVRNQLIVFKKKSVL